MKAANYLWILICLSIIGTNSHAETGNPVSDFLDRRAGEVRGQDVLLMLAVDLTGDGRDEIFLSREEDRNARLGNIWMVYISTNDGYELADNLVSADFGSMICLEGGGAEKDRLFSWISPQKGLLTLIEYLISESTINTKKLAIIELLSEDEDPDIVIDLLRNSGKECGPLEKGKPDELMESLELDANE